MERKSVMARPQDYVELRARSAFSFLEAASNPEELAEAAAGAGHTALALADRDGVSGLPRFQRAAKTVGLRAILGAEVGVGVGGGGGGGGGSESDEALDTPGPGAAAEASGAVGERRADAGDRAAAAPGGRLLLLVETAEGWRRLCRLLSLAHARRDKALEARDPGARARIRVGWDELEAFAGHWSVLVRGDERLDARLLARARAVFGERLAVDVSRLLDRRLARASRRAAELAEACRVPVVASGDVRCARPRDRRLLDALVCLRERVPLDGAGRRLAPNAEGHLQDPAELVRRFADRPEWILATRAIAERCAFGLDALDYRFPCYPLDPGETQMGRLRRLVEAGARRRYGASPPARVRRQLEHELAVIEKLDLAGYFLIVEDVTSFATRSRILCQGRGSAANSAVCYALGITAVDPVKMDLLFERFLSEERGEWPDIDIDFPSGDQRERVIQYVFAKYGSAGAAMTANVITYQTKLAVREMGKVLGQDPEAIDRLSRLLGHLDFPSAAASARERDRELVARLREAKLDPEAPRVRHWLDLVDAVRGLPRHLGQHSGGIVIAAGRLDEVVPIEPATMAGRRIVQWDKDDCADLGIIKIDLLGLGMLAALEETLPLVARHEGIALDLAKLPPDDPATYAMMRRADTVGVFQIESRAQMATLPRLKPKTFYDLVVEIAIIRPGPIVGQMVHPYLNRRAGREPVTYPHDSLRPILERTLGVPIFQEQLLRIAMTAAGFSGGEAEELRRAMGFKRSALRMEKIEARLRAGMRARGLSREAEDQIVLHITSFALYGFPESHSASFALIAYASAYLKRHHPAAFLVGLLRAQPMGFYSPATLIQDARRHGVEIRPVDVRRSNVQSDLEPGDGGGRGRAQEASERAAPAVRIGLDAVGGLARRTAERIVAERTRLPFGDLGDFVRRIAPDRDELEALAELGALAGLRGAVGERRGALWQVAALERDPRSLFAGRARARDAASDRGDDASRAPASESFATASPLRPLSPLEQTLADYRLAGLTTGAHVLAHLRPRLERAGIVPAARLRELPDGAWVRTAGHAIVRQRPGSAKGFCFVTLEDETGLSNAVLTPDLASRFRVPLHRSALLEIAGPLQRVEGVIHVRAREVKSLALFESADPGDAARLPPSHDYR